MNRLIITIFFIFNVTKSIIACDCGQLLPPNNLSATDSFQVITVARIVKLEPCKNKGLATFEGITLYKGMISSPFKVSYDCITSCKMPFELNDIWLLYIKKNSNGEWNVHYCERNRKKKSIGEEDEYTIYNQMTWEEEILFLEKHFPKKDFVDTLLIEQVENSGKTIIDATRPLLHATDRQKIFLIGFSVLGMGLIYFFVKKWLK